MTLLLARSGQGLQAGAGSSIGLQFLWQHGRRGLGEIPPGGDGLSSCQCQGTEVVATILYTFVFLLHLADCRQMLGKELNGRTFSLGVYFWAQHIRQLAVKS